MENMFFIFLEFYVVTRDKIYSIFATVVVETFTTTPGYSLVLDSLQYNSILTMRNNIFWALWKGKD